MTNRRVWEEKLLGRVPFPVLKSGGSALSCVVPPVTVNVLVLTMKKRYILEKGRHFIVILIPHRSHKCGCFSHLRLDEPVALFVR